MLRNAARPGVNRGVRQGDASSYEAKGNGLILAAPKCWASFLVTSSSGAKLRVRSFCARCIRRPVRQPIGKRAASTNRVQHFCISYKSLLANGRPRGCVSRSCVTPGAVLQLVLGVCWRSTRGNTIKTLVYINAAVALQLCATPLPFAPVTTSTMCPCCSWQI
jgi:hypothetical protein